MVAELKEVISTIEKLKDEEQRGLFARQQFCFVH